jgi:sporulation protein YlmC with PRC-barrel domain
MPAFDVARRWTGRVVLDRGGTKLGTVLDVFYDAENDEPGWVLVGVDGDAGTRLVPVAEAVEHGNELRVPYDRAVVLGAPGLEPGGRLWPQEEDGEAVTQVRGLPPR